MTSPRLRVVLLGVLLCVTLGCSRSYRIHSAFNPRGFPIARLAIIPIQTDLKDRGIGSLTIVEQGTQDSFRESLVQGAIASLREMGIEGVEVIGPHSPLPIHQQQEIAFESELERHKILSDIELQGGFTRYARYVSRPSLESLASEGVRVRAEELGVSGFLYIRAEAIKLTRLEYARELIRGALITILTVFLDTTIAHRAYISGDLLIVDGRSARAVFFNSVSDFSGSPGSPEDSLELFQDLLQPFKERLE